MKNWHTIWHVYWHIKLKSWHSDTQARKLRWRPNTLGRLSRDSANLFPGYTFHKSHLLTNYITKSTQKVDERVVLYKVNDDFWNVLVKQCQIQLNMRVTKKN